MKKILIMGEIMLILVLLLGCSVEKDMGNSLLKEKLVAEQISHIEIEVDIYNQATSDKDGLDSIISIINDIEILDSNLEKEKSLEEHDIARIKIYDKSKDIVESISIGKEGLYYNNIWYPVDMEIYDKIMDYYNNSGYKIKEDKNLLDIKERRLNRKEKPITQGLKGTWLDETGGKIKFDENYLYQGSKYEYIFKYNVDKVDNNSLDISVYGLKGIFIEGKELFTSDIKMDKTKTSMVMKKTMADGSIYYEKFVYVGGDNMILGAFDEYFFYQYGNH